MRHGMNSFYGYFAEDASLMKNVVRGDTESFARIVDRYLPLVSRTSFRILCDRKDSEHVTEEVFQRAWENAGDYDLEMSVSEWLLKITCRLCRLRITRRRLLWLLAIRPDIYVTSAPVTDSPDDYIGKKAWEIYCRASVKLTPRQRIVFTLCELEGMTKCDVHRITGYSRFSVRHSLFVAREKIKTELERYGTVV